MTAAERNETIPLTEALTFLLIFSKMSAERKPSAILGIMQTINVLTGLIENSVVPNALKPKH